jgi:hypothetical protein
MRLIWVYLLRVKSFLSLGPLFGLYFEGRGDHHLEEVFDGLFVLLQEGVGWGFFVKPVPGVMDVVQEGFQGFLDLLGFQGQAFELLGVGGLVQGLAEGPGEAFLCRFFLLCCPFFSPTGRPRGYWFWRSLIGSMGSHRRGCQTFLPSCLVFLFLEVQGEVALGLEIPGREALIWPARD